MIAARLNPDWYRVKYNLAALHANWAASLESNDEEGRAEALEHRKTAHSLARELAKVALEQLVEHPDDLNPALSALLEKSILPAALVIYGGTGSRLSDKGARHFHLHDPPKDRRQLLDLVRKGLSEHEALRYAAASTPHPTPRTLYNLACAHTQNGNLEEAERYLEKALSAGPEAERKQLAQRAATDPTLRSLREAGRFEAGERQTIIERVLDALFGSESAEEKSEEEEGPTATA